MSMRIFLMPAALLLLVACNKPSDPSVPSDPAIPPHPVPETSTPSLIPKAEAVPRSAPAKVGADSDAHGCKASAGYTWSQVQEKCLRLFEAGIRLNALVSGAAIDTQVAYVIFDAARERAELFLPGAKAPLLLESRGAEGGQSWEAEEYRLIPWKGYVLQKNGQAIYAGE